MLKSKEELEKKILRLKKKSTEALTVSNLKRINRRLELKKFLINNRTFLLGKMNLK